MRRLLRIHQLALQRQDRQLAQEISLIRTAVWAEGKDFKSQLKSLLPDGDISN